jgi:hypothetical protein
LTRSPRAKYRSRSPPSAWRKPTNASSPPADLCQHHRSGGPATDRDDDHRRADKARDLLTELRNVGLDRTTIAQVGNKPDSLSANLTSIDAAARRRITATTQKITQLARLRSPISSSANSGRRASRSFRASSSSCRGP